MTARDLDWAGCRNVRDLGGLPRADGGTTAMGRIVRADNLDRLTPEGWQALWDYGVRTVIDLRNEEECRTDVVRPAGLDLVRVPFDGYASAQWIEQWDPPGLPRGLRAYTTDYPEALVDFGKAVDSARPGGVVVHCAGGRDRTGLAAMLLLAHVGVPNQEILADYEYSFEQLRPWMLADGTADDYTELDQDAWAMVRARVGHFLEALRPELYLSEAVRERLG